MRAPLLLAVLCLALGACLPTDDGPASEEAVGPAGAAAAGPRLRLLVEPARGPAPLVVRYTLLLEGPLPEGDERWHCPTVAWVLDSRDDGQVVLAPADEACRDGAPRRRFSLTQRFAAAGAFDSYARLLALDLEPSNTVQVVVDGPTPTRQAALGREGPTIVLATPAPPQPARAVTSVAGTLAAYRPQGTPRPQGLPAVLPADLYFLAGRPRGLWRLPADGGPIERLSAADQPVFSYAAGSAGGVAMSGPAGLRLSLRGGGSALVDPAPAEGLVWSRDGRQLAYGNPGLRLLSLGEARPRSLEGRGRPLTFSADGRWLLAAAEGGGGVQGPGSATAPGGQEDAVEGQGGAAPEATRPAETLVALDLRAQPTLRLELPLPAPRLAGWLPDRPAVWLADPGVWLLRLTDPLQSSALLPGPLQASAVAGQADGTLVLVTAAEDPGGRRLIRIDLDEEAEPPGAPGQAGRTDSATTAAAAATRSTASSPPVSRLTIAPGDLAIAPGGRMAARADGTGLWLLDLQSGTEALLLRQPADRPSWVLGRR